ncbi:hypothetical protein FF100_28460 [Methylobacterium terricola]|uniref:Uncharacterized protein n=1 Tax=Methylobacterium terricola TaxID=2583531 RepID=A0A5C4L8Q0_9HYPH|nr:hypothetical protein [Methylobacterium terricola]TNC08773.1 hypothetical protein FF100_28460 [Methylobacterium terricola]
MSITVDWFWTPEPDGRSRVRQVYCDDKLIGRVRRRQKDKDGLIQEWFIAERLEGAFYTPVNGEHPTFKAALNRFTMHGVAR